MSHRAWRSAPADVSEPPLGGLAHLTAGGLWNLWLGAGHRAVRFRNSRSKFLRNSETQPLNTKKAEKLRGLGVTKETGNQRENHRNSAGFVWERRKEEMLCVSPRHNGCNCISAKCFRGLP